MDKDKSFRFRLNAEEDRLLRWLARRMGRSRSDCVRWIIRLAAYDEILKDVWPVEHGARPGPHDAAAMTDPSSSPTPRRASLAGGSHECE